VEKLFKGDDCSSPSCFSYSVIHEARCPERRVTVSLIGACVALENSFFLLFFAFAIACNFCWYFSALSALPVLSLDPLVTSVLFCFDRPVTLL